MKRVPILALIGVVLCAAYVAHSGTPTKQLKFEVELSKADAAMAAGKHGLAITHYRQALTVRPEHADARFQLGTAYQAAGRLYEARRNFRLALTQRPKDGHWEGRCRMQIAACWEASKHYREALHEYRLALAAHPELAEARAGHKRALAHVKH